MNTPEGTSPEFDAWASASADRDQEFEHQSAKWLIDRGYTPHTKGPASGFIGAMGSSEEMWWDQPVISRPNPWSVVAFAAVLALFFLILVKGWPF